MKPVRISKRFITMENYTQDPLNPHPPFPQWATWSVYPYQFWGTMQKYVVKQKYYMLAIENEFLRVTVAPDIGGRIWDLYDKVGKRHLANFNTGVRTYNAGFGLNYTAGGIECNYPLAHSCTTSRQREVSTARHKDGSASVIISELEQIWRTRWSVAYTLYPGRSFVELRVRIYNRTPYDSRYMYWNNCGFVLNKSSQFIFPEEIASMHGEETKTFSWPMWRHQDLSYYRNVREQLGLYMLDATQPYFGYYDHDDEFGLVHYADLADLPGKKSWTWGTQPAEGLRKTHHSRDEVYGEVQSGRIVIQEHLDRMPPETECEWTEMWYPVRDTGAFNGAGPGAAMRVEVLSTSAKRSSIKIMAIGNGFFRKAMVMVTSDGMKPIMLPMPLDPNTATERTLNLKGKAGPDQNTAVILRNNDGKILASCSLRHPNKRDSWREPVDYTRDIEPVGTEQLFMSAEAKARDCGNHDLQPLYEKSLLQDAGFSPARRELGKIAIWKGRFNEAIEHFNIALKRDPDSLEPRYFLGVAMMHAGRTNEARKAFELSNRYNWKPRSLIRLAELRMREKNWDHALKYLDRLADAYPRLSRPRCLRAACLRKLGRRLEASDEIARALEIDRQDPFLQIEAMIIKVGTAGVKRLPSRGVMSLIEQVRAYEPPLLEAAFDYLSVNMHEESQVVLNIIPNAGPLAVFVLAFVNEQLGRNAEAMRLLRHACELNPTGHQVWQLEMINIMEWARQRFPKNPRTVFYLGNLMMARRRTEEGLHLWRQAEEMGEKHYLLFANMGFYESRVAKNVNRAVEYFQKAIRMEHNDLYVKHELFAALQSVGKHTEAIRYLERERDAVFISPLLMYDLLNAYLEKNNYRKFDSLCAAPFDFSVNFQIPGPHLLWKKRYMQESLQFVKAGLLQKALKIMDGLTGCPEHLGMYIGYRPETDIQRLYHMGCIYEKMRKMEDARNYWEKAVSQPRYTGYEAAYWYSEWSARYFQALSLQKLGRESEANAFFDAIELLVHTQELPLAARQSIIELVERGRFALDDDKDPIGRPAVKIETKAES